MSPLLCLAPLGLALATPVVAQDFGFADFEIYEFNDGIHGLAAADFDGDGIADLALINEARSRIEVLIRLGTGMPDGTAPGWDETEPNAIRYAGRYRHAPIPVERRVWRMGVGDLDDDGRAELAFVAEGGRVSVVFDVAGENRRIVKQNVDELRKGCHVLRMDDLDGDGRGDLLLVGDDALLLLPLGAAGTLGQPNTLDHLRNAPSDVHAIDLDGDGRRDLLYTYHDQDRPFRWRLRHADGGLGPRFDVRLPQVRSSTVVDLGAGEGEGLLAVYKLSGRLTLLRADVPETPRPMLARHVLREQEGRAERTFGVGDLNGDGAADVVAASPKDAAVVLFLGRPGSRAPERIEGPSLVGARDPRIGDVDGDGVAELVVVSGPERLVGVARLDTAGRLPFPRGIPVDGEPAAMDLADVDGDGDDDVLLITTSGEGRKREIALQWLPGGPGGPGPEPALRRVLSELKKVPTAVRAADVDGDGLSDLLVFVPGANEVPTILLQRDGDFVGDPRGADIPGLGVLEGAGPAAMSYADVDGDGVPELIAAANNFARTLSFRLEDGRLVTSVGEQFRGTAPDARITSCTAADLDGDDRPEIVLLDERTGELLLFERDAGGGVVLRDRIDAPGVGGQGLVTADVDGDGTEEVVLFGDAGFGVLFARSDVPRLVEAASYEPRKESFHLDRIAVGDFNADGRADVAVTELSKHAITLLEADPPEIRRALGFRVFETKTFGMGSESREPREIQSAELTGDGKADLAVLVHDKLIVYVQE